MYYLEKFKIELPEQVSGSKTDNSDFIEFANLEECKSKYKEIKARILDINNWHNISEGLSGTFILCNKNGDEKSVHPQINDLIKIKLPLTTSIEGEGFDWVRIINLKESFDTDKNLDFLYFTLKPTQNPNTESDSTAHFYTNEATNTYIVLRDDKKIFVGIHGRNEVPNSEQTEGVIDKVRNQGIALGAILGLADPQWKHLIKGLLS